LIDFKLEVIAEILLGTVPLSILLSTDRRVSWVRPPILDGSVPSKEFKSKCNTTSLDKEFIVGGIEPWRELLVTHNRVSACRFPISDGMLPVNELS